ncbi:glycine hydroxymethyltransferase [Pseudomonas sp. TH39(2020)]|uniref:glycine hydroxymethyltransferase n=1 Tax=Pseudomonas sp. TH39(2020) TaxID=2796349 RepID=UPI0019114963|nr:glycine hydroxymethyltransferase [Pseudomonas sp. TH39(2020)]MBK5401466.1 glycine hydroxymethyltransferase [Pseudomonas sp. TH39(2020)]
MALDLDALLAACADRLPQLEQQRLMLYAGANIPSARAMAAYSPALSAYPAMGPTHCKEQPETELVSELEIRASQAAMTLFNAAWAEVRLASCTLANLAIFHAYCQPGDRVLAPAAEHGGHLSQRRGGTPQMAGLVVEDLPFDRTACRLDTARAVELIEQSRPRLVVLGRSIMIKADDIAPVVQAARTVGAKTLFDASHVLGLIAGGTYPNPFDAGVDLISSSTYKTLPGRPQGLVLGRDPRDAQPLRDLLDTRMLANYDAGRLPSLLVTLTEAQANGAEYAAKIIANSAALHRSLRSIGMPVLAANSGEIYTHQLLLPLAKSVDPRVVMTALQAHGILIGTCVDPSLAGHQALRLGTQFITRQGLEATHMSEVARLLAQVLQVSPCGRLQACPTAETAASSQQIREMLARFPLISTAFS